MSFNTIFAPFSFLWAGEAEANSEKSLSESSESKKIEKKTLPSFESPYEAACRRELRALCTGMRKDGHLLTDAEVNQCIRGSQQLREQSQMEGCFPEVSVSLGGSF